MPLLEIIRTKHTSADVIASCMQLSKAIGKTPVLVGNVVGFAANRGFFRTVSLLDCWSTLVSTRTASTQHWRRSACRLECSR